MCQGSCSEWNFWLVGLSSCSSLTLSWVGCHLSSPSCGYFSPTYRDATGWLASWGSLRSFRELLAVYLLGCSFPFDTCLQQLKHRPGMTWKTWQDCDLLSSVMPELIDHQLITLGANLQEYFVIILVWFFCNWWSWGIWGIWGIWMYLGYLGYLVMGSQLRNVAINEELTNES